MIVGLVRQFMSGLGEVHRQQLLSVMLRIRQDHSLITHIARFIHRPPQQQQQGEALKPEEAHDERKQQ